MKLFDVSKKDEIRDLNGLTSNLSKSMIPSSNSSSKAACGLSSSVKRICAVVQIRIYAIKELITRTN